MNKLPDTSPINVNSGFIILLEFSARGGITYERETLRDKIEDRRQEAEFKTLKRVDNVDLHKESRAVLSAAYRVCNQTCTQTPLGFFADEQQLAALEEKFAEIRELVGDFNTAAILQKSARRVVAEIYPVVLNTAHAATAQRLARTVREVLTAARDALRAGDKEAWAHHSRHLPNLDHLATGIQADAIRMALEQLKEARKELFSAIKENPDMDPASIGAMIDFEMVEAAIQHFAPDEDVVA